MSASRIAGHTRQRGPLHQHVGLVLLPNVFPPRQHNLLNSISDSSNNVVAKSSR